MKINTFEEYRLLAARTIAPHNTALVNRLGLTSEAGEVADLVKKIVGHGIELTDEIVERLKFEVGDVIWYVAAIVTGVVKEGIPPNSLPWSLEFTDSVTHHQMTWHELIADRAIELSYSCAEYAKRESGLDDVWFELTAFCSDFGKFTMLEAAQANIVKLEKRHKKGVFDSSYHAPDGSVLEARQRGMGCDCDEYQIRNGHKETCHFAIPCI